MARGILLTDASPLIGLARVDGLPWLKALFGEDWMTVEVRHEYEGEASCIRIALMQESPALLLMDERAGRAVAAEHGLRVAGTAAVIGMAKSRQLTGSARTVFERLHASDFRISAQVIRAVLRRVGE
ncbi:MAG: DUF3368 domain-containing protein [Sulfuritalea sp.]|nr:DUF3368 domain-containing protein [Sulfuritalea sp.]